MSISDTNLLSYIADARAPLYRRIMRAFMERRSDSNYTAIARHCRGAAGCRFWRDRVRTGSIMPMGGNLRARCRPTEVTTIGDFLAARKMFQITREGEAAERALEVFDTGPAENLDSTALADVLGQSKN